MKKQNLSFFIRLKFFCLILFILYPTSTSVGQTELGTPQAQESEAAEPESSVKEVTAGAVTLEHGQLYQSPYLDVRDYREATFYVLEQKVLNSPRAETKYRLDAFFSVNTDSSGTLNFDTNQVEFLYRGWQEFGSLKSQAEESEGSGDFKITSTGLTSSRVLATGVYGPYVRVELRNLTEGDKAKRTFRVYAYLVP